MAKLSIYVPDPLWERAREVAGDDNASGLVQRALQGLVGERATRHPFANEAAEAIDPRVRAEVRARLEAEARQSYREGYESGIMLASHLPWDILDFLAEHGFDIGALDDHVVATAIEAGSEAMERLGDDWADRVGMLLDLYQVETNRRQRWGRLHEQALRQALSDVWDEVAQATRVTND